MFPNDVGTVVVYEMWRRTDWKFLEQPSHYKRDKWLGCNASLNFIDAARCTYHVNTYNLMTDINMHAAPSKRDFKFKLLDAVWPATKLFVVGDSTMKRIFDSLIRMCPERTDFHLWGKVRSNVHAKCGSLLVKYAWSAGDDDTSVALRQLPQGPHIKVIFNTGHNYINLNLTDFSALARRMHDIAMVQGWGMWAVLTSPAHATHLWDPDSRCTFNNVRVQMSNQVLRDTFPARHVVDMFYHSLHSADAVDGTHFKEEYYDVTVQKVLEHWSSSTHPAAPARSDEAAGATGGEHGREVGV